MSGAGGSTNGGGEVKGVVERVLGMRIEKGEVQYLIQIQAWEPARNLKLRCPQKIAEFEKEVKEMAEREHENSQEATSHFADKDGTGAGHSTNSISVCIQNQEENFVEDTGKEFRVSKKVRKIGNGKELESESTSSSTVTKTLPGRRKDEESKEVTSQTVEKDSSRATGIVSSNFCGGSGSSDENFHGRRSAKDVEIASDCSKLISTEKELGTESFSSSTVSDALLPKRRRKNEKSKKVTSQTVEKCRAAGIVCSNASGGSGSNEENFQGKRKRGFAKDNDTERASGGSSIVSTMKELESGSGICSPTVSKELEALLNPVILTNLFAIIPLEQLAELATYRLVCKTWEENSRLTWRSSSCVQLGYAKKKITLLPGTKSKNPTTLAEFLEFWDHECSLKPYRGFYLKDWKLFETSVGKGKTPASLKCQIDRFWDMVGINMTALTLANCGFSGADEMRKILFQSCPNLKKLALYECTVLCKLDRVASWKRHDTTEYREPVYGEQRSLKSLWVCLTPSRFQNEWTCDFPVSGLEMLSHFPALTSLRISCPLKGSIIRAAVRFAKVWMNAIKVIRRHDESKLLLKVLQIDLDLCFDNDTETQEYFSLLRELNASFYDVDIDLGVQTAGENAIKDLILFHGKNLQTIFAKEWERNAVNVPNFGFPYGVELDNLLTLDMWDSFCQNMEFIKYTPNLEILRIYQRDHRRETHLVSNTFGHELENFPLVKLKKLELSCKFSDDDLKRLSKWLPNIEALKMSLNDSQFVVICEHWSQLVHLHVTALGLSDEGILGTGSALESGEANRIKVIQAPILRLSGLKCLKIKGGPNFSRTEITELSAVNGFMKLPQLEILNFNCETGFGLATKMDLCANIPNCTLHSLNARSVSCPCCVRGVGNGRGAPKKLASCNWN